MTISEIQKSMDTLFPKKKTMEQSKNLCILVLFVLCYYVYQSVTQQDGTPWWFFLVMGLMIVLCVGILIYDYKVIKKLSDEINQLAEEKAAMEEAESEDEEDAEDEPESIEDNRSNDEPDENTGE